MTEHTPAPWTVDSDYGTYGHTDLVVMAHGYFIATLHGIDGGVDAANANLIAAAPEMHDALALGVAMRAAQNRYFKNRSQENLIASKAAEAAFDKAAKGALDKADGAMEQGGLL